MKTYDVGRISFPINTSTRNAIFIPPPELFIQDTNNEKIIERVLSYILDCTPVLLEGETGGGKTLLIKYLANKTNNGLCLIQLTGGTEVDNLIGRFLLNKDGTYFQPGPIITSMINGLWCYIDELNMANPEVLAVLNQVIQERQITLDHDLKPIKAHPDFRVIVAQNPWEDYTGTKELNKALLDRFACIKVDYPVPALEKKIIMAHTGLKDNKINGKQSIVSRMVKFANAIREHKQKEKNLIFVCSTRQLIQWGKALQRIGIFQAAQDCILNKADELEQTILKDILKIHFAEGEDQQIIIQSKTEDESSTDFINNDQNPFGLTNIN